MNATEDFIGLNAAVKKYGISVLTFKKRIERGDLQAYLDPFDDRRTLLKVSEIEALRRVKPLGPRVAVASRLAQALEHG